MAEVHEHGELVLTTDEQGAIFNAHHDKVGQIVEQGHVSMFDGSVCYLQDDGSILDSHHNFLGKYANGRVLDEYHNLIAIAKGEMGGEAGAALLALKTYQPSAVEANFEESTGLLGKRHKQVIVVDRRREYRDQRDEEDSTSSIKALVLIGLIITASILALVFLLVTSPIWIGMVVAGLFTQNYLLKAASENQGENLDWIELDRKLSLKRQSVMIGLTYGLIASGFLTAVNKGLSTLWLCLGAVAFGVLVMLRISDRYGRFVCRKIEERPEKFLAVRAPIAEWLRQYSTFGAICACVLLGMCAAIAGYRGINNHAIVASASSPPASYPNNIRQEPRESSTTDRTDHPATENVRSDTTESIPPESSKTSGSPGGVDLSKLSMFDLDCLRNEPYARHGYAFKRQDLREHFQKERWYRPTTSDQSGIWTQLSHGERELILRVKAEQAKRR